MEKQKRIELDDPHLTITFVESASERSDTVLFLHGWGVSAAAFAEFLDVMAARFRVVAPDLPGFGGSARLPRASYTAYADACARFIGRLGLGPVHVVGASMGGGIAMKLAANHPRQLRSLTVVGPTGCPNARLTRLAANRIGEVALQLVHPEYTRGKGRIIRSFLGNLVSRPGSMIAALRMLSSEDVLTDGTSVDVPALPLWGEKDRTIPVALADHFAACCSRSRLEVVPNAYHELTTAHPELVARIVTGFIEGLDAAAAS